jgi:hypothetical protein
MSAKLFIHLLLHPLHRPYKNPLADFFSLANTVPCIVNILIGKSFRKDMAFNIISVPRINTCF